MNTALLLLFCGTLFGFSVAETPRNPTCDDLEALQKNLKSYALLSTINCKPNENCSGLDCHGTFKGKSFKGTVILQGCQEPVTLVIHFGNHHLNVTNNSKTKLVSPLYAFTTIEKENNVVYVSVTIKTCLFHKCTVLWRLLKRQKIRLNCGNTRPTMQVLIKNAEDKKYYRYSHAISKKSNPECKGLKAIKTKIENNFLIISSLLSDPGNISCNPSNDCSELRCTGFAKKEKFNGSIFIDYCSSPVTLRLRVDVPGKNIHMEHTFIDGQKYKLFGKVPIIVHLRRDDNIIYVTIGVFVVFVEHDIVKDLPITVDPSRCPGYHKLTTPMPTIGGQECRSMISMGNAIEKGTRNSVSCSPTKTCKELRCAGLFDKENFTSVTSMSYCTSPVTMNMHITVGRKTYSRVFKNGDRYKMPLPITVGLKRMKNDILVNISVGIFSIVRNHVFTVDPSQCPGMSDKSLTAGELAGIIIGAIIFIALVVFLVLLLMRKYKGVSARVTRYNDLAMSDDTDPLYEDFEPALA